MVIIYTQRAVRPRILWLAVFHFLGKLFCKDVRDKVYSRGAGGLENKTEPCGSEFDDKVVLMIEIPEHSTPRGASGWFYFTASRNFFKALRSFGSSGASIRSVSPVPG